MISPIYFLLAAIVMKATARREVETSECDPVITCKRFPTAPPQSKSCFSLYNCHIFEQCPEINRVAYINCRLNVLICVITAVAVVFVVGFVLSLLSGDQGFPRAGYAYAGVRRRGRYNSIIATSGPVGDGLVPSDPPQAGTNRPSPAERGRKRSVEAYTSGPPLNTTLARKDTRTVVDQPLATQVPLPAFDDIQLDPTNVWDHFLAYFGTSIPDELSWSNFSPYQYIFRVINTRLLRSLYGWRPPLFILVIAVDDAIHDHGFLKLTMEAWTSRGVHFAGLTSDVTLSSINAAIRRLYDKSIKVPGSEVFIILTGHGDDANMMILSGGDTISEATLFSLLQAVRKNYSKPTPVTVLFDICRPAFLFNSAAPHGVSSVRSCFPGEKAGACRFPGVNAPYSCFLIALIMAARTPNFEYTGEAGKVVIQERLDQFTTYLRGIHQMRHSSGGCTRCSGSRQHCVEPKPQNVDWRDARASDSIRSAVYPSSHKFKQNMDGLLELIRVLSGTEIAEQVYQRFIQNDHFRRLNNLPGPKRSWSVHQAEEEPQPGVLSVAVATSSLVLDFSPLPSNTSNHERGANEPVHAG